MVRPTLLCVCLLASACASSSPPEPAAPAPAPAAEVHRIPELGGVGLCQSPIDISSRASAEGHHEVHVSLQASRERILHKAHTVELEWDEGSQITFDGQTYRLRQLHFHTPSEHRVDGVTYPLEAHLVHTLVGDDQRYLVISGLFEPGAENPFLARFLAAVPEQPQGEVVREEALDLRELQDGRREYYTYVGSLTTPPYTEGVRWVVMKSLRQASPAQLERLQRLEGRNARQVQPLNARTVEGR